MKCKTICEPVCLSSKTISGIPGSRNHLMWCKQCGAYQFQDAVDGRVMKMYPLIFPTNDSNQRS